MKYKLLIFLILVSGITLNGISQNALRNVKFAVGQAVYELPASTKINGEIDWHFADSITTHNLIRKAIADALEQFGTEKPKLLLIMGRAEDKHLVKSAIEAANTDHIPYIFDGSNWAEYTVIGPAAVTHQLQQSFIAFAMGGGADYQVHSLHVPMFKDQYWSLEQKYGKDSTEKILAVEKVKYVRSAKELANQFDTTRSGKKVYIQLGNFHTPRQNWVLEGMSEVFKNMNIVGGAQADWGWQIIDGKLVESTLYGIMITGDFSVSQAMGARNMEEALHIQSERILKNALNNSEQEPDIALYFGCAGWNSDQNNQYDVIKKLLPNIAFFGRFNGGEIGRFVNSGQNQAGIDLLSVLFIYNHKNEKQ
jgi:hypothetical protein